MKRLYLITNMEWVHEHKHIYLNELENILKNTCPSHYGLESTLIGKCCEANSCGDCWLLPAKINGKYISKKLSDGTITIKSIQKAMDNFYNPLKNKEDISR